MRGSAGACAAVWPWASVGVAWRARARGLRAVRAPPFGAAL